MLRVHMYSPHAIFLVLFETRSPIFSIRELQSINSLMALAYLREMSSQQNGHFSLCSLYSVHFQYTQEIGNSDLNSLSLVTCNLSLESTLVILTLDSDQLKFYIKEWIVQLHFSF